MKKLTPKQIKPALAKIPEWKRKGSAIFRIYEFKEFLPAVQFVNRVAKLAEKAAHHPDIDIRWNKVRLALTTHDAHGLTTKDFELAEQLDKANGPS